jgi:GrpB-like predicted nucleotidyltransferase (UPF0157 family)
MIEVVDYDDDWPRRFDSIRAKIWPHVSHLARRIEHVGSTSVPRLAAKPILDIDVIVDEPDVPAAIAALATLGYTHQGDLGVPQREAFKHADAVRHNLYVCVDGSLHLRNHFAVRDALRADSALADEYGRLKRELAARFPNDIDAYVHGKNAFIARLLAARGFTPEELAAIASINR